MQYTQWDVNKAAEVGNAKGRAIGYVAGVYSTPGMSNISAATAEAINQDGGSIYQDQDGHFHIKYDRNTYGGTVWTSDALGVTFDYSGDTFTMTPTGGYGGYDGDDFYSTYTNSFSSNCDSVINRLQASDRTGVSYASTEGLKTNETIDPVTGRVIDKGKSQEIDEMNLSKANQYKFDKIAELINKVNAAQSAAKVTSSSAKTIAGGTLAGAAAGAAIGTVVPVIGTAVGAVVGGIAGFLGGHAVAASDKSTAKEANNQRLQEAAEAGAELRKAIEGLSDEELVAFQRYYYEQTGVQVADVLQALEVDENSSEIAQRSGINSEWLSKTFDKMDDADNILDVSTTESSSNSGSLSQNAEIQLLQKEADTLYQQWQASLNGKTVVIDGKTMTTAELRQMYLDKVAELEKAQA